jgi:hypothetical protein
MPVVVGRAQLRLEIFLRVFANNDASINNFDKGAQGHA